MPRAVATVTGAPFVKLVDLGDTIVGAFAGSAQQQRREYTSGNPLTKPDGRPALEEILHFVAMPGTTANTGTDEAGYTLIKPGEHVRFSVSGYRWGQVIEARKELPAAHGMRAGQIASSDVYTISLTGWSASTDNAAAATKAGFTVVDSRIVMRDQEAKDRYVLARSRKNQSTGVGKDLTIAIRRIELPTEQRWADLADALYDTRPWEGPTQPPTHSPDDGDGDEVWDEEEPF
jgi:hypothetical protein